MTGIKRKHNCATFEREFDGKPKVNKPVLSLESNCGEICSGSIRGAADGKKGEIPNLALLLGVSPARMNAQLILDLLLS